MENILRKNLSYSFKFILIHLILYPLNYAIDIANFIFLLSLKIKSFFISCYIVQGLVLIFMVKMLGLFKSSYDSTENIKCSLIIYTCLSAISLIFSVVEYFLILKNISLPNSKLDIKYKYSIIGIGIFYHIYNNLIFIYECYIVNKGVKQNIEDRVQLQITERHTDVDNNKNETQSSEKPSKNESFVKEDTVYIIEGKFNDNSKESYDKNIEYINKIKLDKDNINTSERNIDNYIININNNKKDQKENINNANTIIPNEHCFIHNIKINQINQNIEET